MKTQGRENINIFIFRKEICEYCVTGEIKAEDGKFL